MNERWISSACQGRSADSYTGTAVFLSGLKNGIFTTLAVTVCRTASMVISICSLVPICECAVSTLASAIIFFSTGDHVVVVALPTCLSSRYTGTATREAWLGAAGDKPEFLVTLLNFGPINLESN